MKKIRSALLSVLLSVFAFFVVHDYVFVNVDADTQYELCYAERSGMYLDLPSQIHEHIHVLQAVPEAEPHYETVSVSENVRPGTASMPLPPVTDVPQRPPLS